MKINAYEEELKNHQCVRGCFGRTASGREFPEKSGTKAKEKENKETKKMEKKKAKKMEKKKNMKRYPFMHKSVEIWFP